MKLSLIKRSIAPIILIALTLAPMVSVSAVPTYVTTINPNSKSTWIITLTPNANFPNDDDIDLTSLEFVVIGPPPLIETIVPIKTANYIGNGKQIKFHIDADDYPYYIDPKLYSLRIDFDYLTSTIPSSGFVTAPAPSWRR